MSYFHVESSGTFGSSDIFGSSDQPPNESTRITHFPCYVMLRGYKLYVEGEGELSLFNNEFVLFCINNEAQLSVHLSNTVVSLKELWRFFDTG